MKYKGPNKINIVCDYDGCFHRILPFLKAFNISPIILTGRPPSEEANTLKELEGIRFQKLFVYPKNYSSNSFTHQTKMDIANWKAKMIKIIKGNATTTIYIDDDITYWRRVSDLNPDIICLLV